ncbi:MAG: hypothetical protein ACI4FZ_07610 [Lachnospiraceae bacterium]
MMRQIKRLLVFLAFILIILDVRVTLIVLAADDDAPEHPYPLNVEYELTDMNPQFVFPGKTFFSKPDYKHSPYKLIIGFDKISGYDYEIYDAVFGFQLLSKDSSGSHTTEYVTTISLANQKYGIIDKLLLMFNLKNDFYEFEFSYQDLINKSEHRDNKNTVISSFEVYLKNKNTNETGYVSHFDLVWDENFENQCIKQVSYYLTDPQTGDIYLTDSLSNITGVTSFSAKGNAFGKTRSFFATMVDLLTDVPSMLVSLLSGVISFLNVLPSFFKAVFPFIPGVFFDILGVLIYLVMAVGLYQLAKGLANK